jgi:hypothetical protein
MRTLIGTISLVGATLFASVFALSYINPTFVESIAREVVRQEVERRVGERLTNLEGSKIAEIARRVSGQNAAEIAELERNVAEGVPRKVAEIASRMLDADCECRKAIERTVTGVFENRTIELSRLNERLALLIRTKYMEVAESLTREFRIFSGANALVFALLGITVAVRKRARLQLALPALVLLGAGGLIGYLYIFNQNWLHSVVFGEYVGLAYFGYLGVAVTFLADITFNKARVTTELLNAVFHAVGSAIQVVPC